MAKNQQFARYPTYVFLRGLLENAETKVEKDFQTTLSFLPNSFAGRNEAYRTFRKKLLEFAAMKEELHAVFASTYKDHPIPETRKFWGLE